MDIIVVVVEYDNLLFVLLDFVNYGHCSSLSITTLSLLQFMHKNIMKNSISYYSTIFSSSSFIVFSHKSTNNKKTLSIDSIKTVLIIILVLLHNLLKTL